MSSCFGCTHYSSTSNLPFILLGENLLSNLHKQQKTAVLSLDLKEASKILGGWEGMTTYFLPAGQICAISPLHL